DECDLEQGSPEDCDNNGLADAQEIADNPELDCNLNGRLDFCDIALSREPIVFNRSGGLRLPIPQEVGFEPAVTLFPAFSITPVRLVHTVYAYVYNTATVPPEPLTFYPVTFRVISGPNEGFSYATETD